MIVRTPRVAAGSRPAARGFRLALGLTLVPALFSGLLAGFALQAHAQAGSPAEKARGAATAAARELDAAGRLRMLAQRTAKAHLMVALDIEPDEGRRLLDQSMQQFERHLGELRAAARDQATRDAVGEVDRAWPSYRAQLLARPSATSTREVYDGSEIVQAAAHRVVLAFERAAGAAGYRWINVAGRQRMLSQRMAKFSLFRHTATAPRQAVDMELKFSVAEFSSGMHQLAQAPGLDDEMRAALESVDREWISYRRELTSVRDDVASRRAMPELLRMSESLLAATEKLVALFAATAERR